MKEFRPYQGGIPAIGGEIPGHSWKNSGLKKICVGATDTPKRAL
jgi:hypothetical protein